MAFEKILILESTWAANFSDYISDSRSTSEIYTSLRSIMSVQTRPVWPIVRPLLKSRFRDDLRQFVGLRANKKGPNVVVLSAHGSHELSKAKKHRRLVGAIDGKINLSAKIKDMVNIYGPLEKTIFVLDACSIGQNIRSFRQASGALGVIGFSEDTDWVDSSVFVLGLLLKFQEDGIFQMRKTAPDRPHKVLQKMKSGAFRSLMRELGVEYKFSGIP